MSREAIAFVFCVADQRPCRHRQPTASPAVSGLLFSVSAPPMGVANAVTYLASDESAWTVGAEITIDGGRLLNA